MGYYFGMTGQLVSFKNLKDLTHACPNLQLDYNVILFNLIFFNPIYNLRETVCTMLWVTIGGF